MSDRDGDSAPAAAVSWLDEATLLALRLELHRQQRRGVDAHRARRAVRDLLTGLRPSLPFPMLDQGAALLPVARGAQPTARAGFAGNPRVKPKSTVPP